MSAHANRGIGLVLALTLCTAACASATEPGHTFEIIDEGGIPTAVSSAIPKYEGEIFRYEKILELRPDPDNFDETYLYQPRSFTLGDDGLFYVADTGNSRIAVFDGEGRFVRAFGREGQGPGELQEPRSVSVRDGIATVRARRTSRFRTDGTFLDVIPSSGRGDTHLATNGMRVAFDLPQGPQDDGYYYVQMRARVLDVDGDEAATIETDQVAFARMMPDAVMGREELQFAGMPHLGLLPGNEILATPGDRPLLEWYGLDGELKRRARVELPLEPITDEDRAAVQDRYDRLIERNMAYGADEGLRDQLLAMKETAQYADHKGFWWQVEAEEPGGWLWLTEPVPHFGLYFSGVPKIEQQQVFRIVSPEGEYIGETRWPAELDRFASHVARGHLMAMVADLETGEEVPTVYRITPAVEGLDYPGGR
ncbi:MAG: 6-bladed beta-propeller [Acidobacteriota bacterium]